MTVSTRKKDYLKALILGCYVTYAFSITVNRSEEGDMIYTKNKTECLAYQETIFDEYSTCKCDNGYPTFHMVDKKLGCYSDKELKVKNDVKMIPIQVVSYTSQEFSMTFATPPCSYEQFPLMIDVYLWNKTSWTKDIVIEQVYKVEKLGNFSLVSSEEEAGDSLANKETVYHAKFRSAIPILIIHGRLMHLNATCRNLQGPMVSNYFSQVMVKLPGNYTYGDDQININKKTFAEENNILLKVQLGIFSGIAIVLICIAIMMYLRCKDKRKRKSREGMILESSVSVENEPVYAYIEPKLPENSFYTSINQDSISIASTLYQILNRSDRSKELKTENGDAKHVEVLKKRDALAQNVDDVGEKNAKWIELNKKKNFNKYENTDSIKISKKVLEENVIDHDYYNDAAFISDELIDQHLPPSYKQALDDKQDSDSSCQDCQISKRPEYCDSINSSCTDQISKTKDNDSYTAINLDDISLASTVYNIITPEASEKKTVETVA